MTTRIQSKVVNDGTHKSAVQIITRRTFGNVIVQAALILICAVWTIPTIGLLVTSLRHPDDITRNGWWVSWLPVEEGGRLRVNLLDSSNDAVEDEFNILKGETGTFSTADGIIARNEAKAAAERQATIDAGENPLPTVAPRTIISFGIGPRAEGNEFNAGETVNFADLDPEVQEGAGGLTEGSLVINADGSFEMTAPANFDRARLVLPYRTSRAPGFSFNNYNEVINNPNRSMGQAFLNSLTITIPATIIPIAIAAFAAYAFAWMEFPGRRILFVIVVGLQVVPLQMSLIPMLRIYTSLDLNGTFVGIWLAHTGFGMPLAVFLLWNYISNLPREIIESANIDGATHFQIFIQLILPLSVPALASFAIFQFLWVWNDLLVALVFLGQGTARPVTAVLQEMAGSRGANWEILTAGAFVTMILPLLVFFSFQRYFVRGLLAGSVKGG